MTVGIIAMLATSTIVKAQDLNGPGLSIDGYQVDSSSSGTFRGTENRNWDALAVAPTDPDCSAVVLISWDSSDEVEVGEAKAGDQVVFVKSGSTKGSWWGTGCKRPSLRSVDSINPTGIFGRITVWRPVGIPAPDVLGAMYPNFGGWCSMYRTLNTPYEKVVAITQAKISAGTLEARSGQDRWGVRTLCRDSYDTRVVDTYWAPYSAEAATAIAPTTVPRPRTNVPIEGLPRKPTFQLGHCTRWLSVGPRVWQFRMTKLQSLTIFDLIPDSVKIDGHTLAPVDINASFAQYPFVKGVLRIQMPQATGPSELCLTGNVA